MHDGCRPAVTVEWAQQIATEVFGLVATSAQELPSYDDRNFCITVESGEKFILKASNFLETKADCEFMNNVMSLLHNAGLSVQQPLPSKDGNLVETVPIESQDWSSKKEHAVRLLTFLQGYILDDPQVRVDAALLRDFGATVARVDRTLSRHLPDLQPPEDMLWCLQSVPRLRDFVFAVQEASDRDLVLSVIAAFERDVLPRIGSLTKGVIHGDPNDHNVIVRERSAASDSSFEIVGMLDWQETHRAPVIFDLAILCMYVLACHKPTWKTALLPLSVAKPCIEGFLSEWPLPQEELRLLPQLVLARFAQSLCLGTYSFHILDSKNPYVMDNFSNEWKCFRALCAAEPKALLAEWTELCDE